MSKKKVLLAGVQQCAFTYRIFPPEMKQILKIFFFNILMSYGEIMKYGLTPLTGLRLGLRIFADRIKVDFDSNCIDILKQRNIFNRSVEHTRDIMKSRLRPSQSLKFLKCWHIRMKSQK